jgi:hypothetical protein
LSATRYPGWIVRAAITVAWAALPPAPALAQPQAAPVASLATAVANVAIVAPHEQDAVIAEAISRLRSELGVVGLDSHIIGCDAEEARDARACADPQNGATRPDPPGDALPRKPAVATAIISLAREDGVVTIEVIERLADGSKFFRLVYVPVRDGGGDPSVLAVRSVELLRDVHLDVERSEAAPKIVATPTPAPVVVVAAPASVPSVPGRWRIAATAGLLQGRNGLGPRVAPALGIARALGPRVSAMAIVSGPFFEDLQLTSEGVATTRQEFGLLGARAELGAGRVRPFGTVAVGLFHMTAQGRTSDPTVVPRGSSLWAMLGAAGVGGAFKLTRFVDLVAEGDLLLAGPAGQVTIQSTVVGTAGAPSLLFQAGLWVALP